MVKRKGDPTDIILLMVILFFLAISIVVALFVNSQIQNVISTTVLNSSSAYADINYTFNKINTLGVQRSFTLIFGLLIIGILVSSFLIRVHPIFIFIYIITLGVAIFVSIFLANTYEMMVANEQLALIAENYAVMTYIMQHIAVILLAVGALSMVIIFSKIGVGGQESPV